MRGPWCLRRLGLAASGEAPFQASLLQGAVTVPVSKLPNYRLALYRLIFFFFRLAYASSTSSLFVNLTALLDRGVSSFLARIVEQLKVFCLFVRKELTSL